jgi:hypothetical protein
MLTRGVVDIYGSFVRMEGKLLVMPRRKNTTRRVRHMKPCRVLEFCPAGTSARHTHKRAK